MVRVTRLAERIAALRHRGVPITRESCSTGCVDDDWNRRYVFRRKASDLRERRRLRAHGEGHAPCAGDGGMHVVAPVMDAGA